MSISQSNGSHQPQTSSSPQFSALLARIHQWSHVENRVDLKSRRAHAQCWMVGTQGNRLLEVLCFHNRDTAQHLLRLDKRAVSNRHLAVLLPYGHSCTLTIQG